MTAERAKDIADKLKEIADAILSDKPGSLAMQHDIEELLEAGIALIVLREKFDAN